MSIVLPDWLGHDYLMNINEGVLPDLTRSDGETLLLSTLTRTSTSYHIIL